MSDQWVVLELNSKADGEDPDIIRKAITSTIKGADVFIPAEVTQVGADRVVHYLVEGYAFIRHTFPDAVYRKLENTRYIASVLTTTTRVNGSRPARQLALVPEANIEKMRRQMYAETDQGIGMGDTVLVTSGCYKQITAKVIEEIPEEDKVQIHVQLRSKDTIVTLPRSFLKLVSRAERPPFMDRFTALKLWFGDFTEALHLPDWQADLTPIATANDRYRHLCYLSDAMEPQMNVVAAFDYKLDTNAIITKYAELTQLESWVNQIEDVSSVLKNLDTQPLKVKHRDWSELHALQSKLDEIRDEVIKVERKITGKKDMDNIIIDGLNLVFRVHYAPGMADLADSKGRQTGIIVGFLRVLASMRKKFPGADVYVCWEGSSARRKSKFAGYKSSRKPHSVGWDQVETLQEILPYLGVRQVSNPEEEADDVIASLVRGQLNGYRNVILSTDRDMFQLVTDKTFVFTPTQGKSHEKLHGPDDVLEKWGVRPEKLVEFRAMDGDDSDDIPGVPTVPSKVLAELLNLYGSIDAIYASNLAGVTKKRYECLQSAKAQVKLNKELMTLYTVDYSEVAASPDKEIATAKLEDFEIDAEPITKSLLA